MPFPRDVIGRAWTRQAGRCAYCGKRLVWANYDRGTTGAWHAHHRKPEFEGGTDTLRNCVILCINPPNCHFNVGHGGISWSHYEPLNDSQLPCLYAGRKARRRRSAVRRKKRATTLSGIRILRI